MNLALIILLWIASTYALIFFSLCEAKRSSMSKELDMLLDKKYDSRFRPKMGEAPLMIGLNIDFSSLNRVSQLTMDYTMTLYLYQTWEDCRLSIKHGVVRKMNITLTNEVLDKVWLPDTCFNNDKESFIHSVTKKNHLLKIQTDGTVRYGMRLTPHLTCLMDLKRFPMDEQTCLLELESYGYTVDDMQYYLLEGPENAITGFDELKHSEIQVESVSTTVYNTSLETGVYSRVAMKFIFSRSTVHYIFQIYAPCASITVVSWLSFWIEDTATSARTTLGVTSIFTIITIGINNRHTLPQISYLSALEIYCLVCFAFVFLSFVEFMAVNWFFIDNLTKQKEINVASHLSDRPSLLTPTTSVRRRHKKPVNCNKNIEKRSIDKSSSLPTIRGINSLDRTSQIFFPVAFLCFNLYYWIFYRYM